MKTVEKVGEAGVGGEERMYVGGLMFFLFYFSRKGSLLCTVWDFLARICYPLSHLPLDNDKDTCMRSNVGCCELPCCVRKV